MDQGIYVLSLFDGMSCGQIALQRAGIKVNQYFASEIDQFAIKVTQANYPNTIQLGDITKVSAKDLPKIDLTIGGSPCQGFSFAGKQLAFDDPRSRLFFEYLRLWNEVKAINPNAYFLLENVKMKKEHEVIISNYMGVAPIEINSALVSAQNRVRLYWTNIANKPYGLFGDMECTIPQPKDKKIFLKDILEKNVPDKYYISDRDRATIIKKKGIGFNPRINADKSGCITTSKQSSKLSIDSATTLIINKEGNLKPNQNKSGCFTAGGNSGGNHSDMDLLLDKDNRIRRLTPLECCRLQTVQDDYFYKDGDQVISDTQIYKCLGNGWTVDAIVHILSFMDLPNFA